MPRDQGAKQGKQIGRVRAEATHGRKTKRPRDRKTAVDALTCT